jgi:hypothetical protein
MPERWESITGMTVGLKAKSNEIIAAIPSPDGLIQQLNDIKDTNVQIAFDLTAGTGFYDHETNVIHLNPNQPDLVQANTFFYESYNAKRRQGFVSAFSAKGQRKFKEAADGVTETEYHVTKEFADLAATIPTNLQDDATKKVLNERRGGGTDFLPESGFKAAFLSKPHDSAQTDQRSLPTPDMYYFENISGAGPNQIEKFIEVVVKSGLAQAKKAASGHVLHELVRYWPTVASNLDGQKARVRRFQHVLDRLERFVGQHFPGIHISQATKSFVGYQPHDWSNDPSFKPSFQQQHAGPFATFPSGT